MDYNLPGSSVHGILQTRILVWVVISVSRGDPSQPRDQTHISCIGRQILYHWVTWEVQSWCSFKPPGSSEGGRKARGPSTPQDTKANWEKPSIGHLFTQPCWATKSPSMQLSPSLEHGRLETSSAQSPRSASSSKPMTLSLLDWPHYAPLPHPKVHMGRWGPTRPALLPLPFSPHKPWSWGVGSYLSHQT